MWTSSIDDFSLIDSGNGMKLERWGKYILSRPEPQAIWSPAQPALWERADGVYTRSSSGGGSWDFKRQLPESWNIKCRDLTFKVRPTGFKHTGIFPEQAVNWEYIGKKVAARVKSGHQPNILNLFSYTGAATMAAAKAGARVTHVDAAKGIVAWAKENSVLCGLGDAPIRYIVDDCKKFVMREQRRGVRYDGIIMDPPSYGRGPNGEMFRFENDVYPLVLECAKVLTDDPLFFILNSYTAGFAPAVAENTLISALVTPRGGKVEADNIGLKSETGLYLPCGATARWTP